ncbi:MAG: SPOR domain-containing protein [Schleiferiaceae bacterium]
MAALHYTLDVHLAFLLFQEDSVAVPGLGTFSVRRYGAEIQLPAGLILPPARRVSYSPQAESVSPALLAHLFAVEGLDAEAAEVALRQAVDAYREVLERGDRLTLRGIGSVRRHGAQWTFKASLEANFLSESYGLPMFRMDLVQEQASPLRSDSAPAPKVRSWQAAAIVAGALGLAAIGGTKDDVRASVKQAAVEWNVPAWWSNQKTSLLRTWDSWSTELEAGYDRATEALRSNADEVSEVALTATNEGVDAVASVPAPASEVPAAEPVAVAPEVAAPKAAEAPKAANAPKAVRKIANDKGQYALIVGAFVEDANAERLAKTLKAAGYPAQVLDASVGLKKVALRTFASEEAARSAKAKLKADFPAIWIYHE